MAPLKKTTGKVRIGDLSARGARADELTKELSAQELAMVSGGYGTYHYFRTMLQCGNEGGDDDGNGYCTVDS